MLGLVVIFLKYRQSLDTALSTAINPLKTISKRINKLRNTINSLVKTTLFIASSLCVSSASAKSECHELALRIYFKSDLSHKYMGQNNPDRLEDFLTVIHDTELGCKMIVKAIKTKSVSAEEARTRVDRELKSAKEQYEKDGDMDALELGKLGYELGSGSIDIAEK